MKNKLIVSYVVSVILIIVGIIGIVVDLIKCLNMEYPHPMLGIDANCWVDQFGVDMVFFMLMYGWVMIIALIVLIKYLIKFKKNKLKEADINEVT